MSLKKHTLSSAPVGSSGKGVPGRVGPTPLLLPAKRTEDWKTRNDRLVRSGGRGRPYPEAFITMMVLVMSAYHLSLRQARGFLKSLALWGGVLADMPDYSTLARRRKLLDLSPALPRRHALVVDSSGISLVHESMSYARKTGSAPRKGRHLKMHLKVDPSIGEVSAAVVTESSGTGSGDVSVGPELVRAASPTGVACADMAYDSKKMYEAARESGARDAGTTQEHCPAAGSTPTGT